MKLWGLDGACIGGSSIVQSSIVTCFMDGLMIFMRPFFCKILLMDLLLTFCLFCCILENQVT